MPSSSLLKPIIVVCFLALLVPLAMSTAPSCREDSTATSSMLSKMGKKLLEYTVEEAFPTSQLYTNNTTRELNETHFHEKVCSYFGHYHRFYWRLRYLLSQNNTEHEANASLLTLLLKKSTKSMCSQFKNACADRDVCANLDCTINSIATLCLGVPTKAQLVNFIQPPVELPTEGRPMLVQLWMQLNLSSDNLISGALERLSYVLESATFIRCTIPDGRTATTDQIRCSYIL